jgi:polyferredoxin
MAYATAILLKWSIRAKDKGAPIDLPFVIFIFVMMLAMVVSAVVYFLAPSTGLLLDLVVVNMFVMSGGLLPILLILSLRLQNDALVANSNANKASPASQSVVSDGHVKLQHRLIPTVVALVLLNEFFMGWALVLASGGSPSVGLADPLALFASVVNSYWFIFTMSAEMALTAFFLRREIYRPLLYVIAFQAVVMFLSPPAIQDPAWLSFALFTGSAAMIALFIFIFEFLARNNTVDGTTARYLPRLMVAYALMMGGLFVWLLSGAGFVFAVSIILEMVIYFNLILGSRNGAKKSWLLDAKWTVGLISTLFIAEFFMGGLLDLQIIGKAAFLGNIALAPIAGTAAGMVGAALYNFLIFFGAITGSSWFLIMMGIEMGALVVFKIGTVREFETKIRLVLVLIAYAVYAVLLPSFLISSSALPTIPFIGWSMGVGTAGAVAPSLIAAIVGTYAISAVLSFLFGARQVCSVFCTAALMYQGTFYDKMKTFNRSSSIAKKFLSSRLSNLYRTIFSVVWISLLAAVIVSYLDSIGILKWSIFGSDPTQLLYVFYFDFLWYIIFITIPFVGSYACVSMGWCHWGTFNQLVSRLGFFKLKVKNAGVCATCATKDCALACPVGLTDLPGQFIQKGQFRSHKCIGIGDCSTACPYANIKFYDVRAWFRNKVSKPPESNWPLLQIGTNLPKVGSEKQEMP